ncbi:MULTISPECIES: cytochrome P450 [unclassified Polaromonas]|uniref:cytochrome P450 n=1 Tax=unclassified Polaromonas TaxID=2638319 RepID=UPI0013DE503F|nr:MULTISPECIES: cytochrome P450 [unclassified Polaromonas]
MTPHAKPETAPEHILAASAHRNPYPYYASLVAGPALVFDAPRKLWIAGSAASVKAVLGNPACHVRPAAEPVPAAIVGSAAGEVFGHLVRMNEGLRHDAPKLALQRFLAGVDLGRVKARTEVLAATQAGQGPLHGSALSRWAFEVPVMAVADMLGFAEDELPQVARWMGDFVACLSPVSTAAQLAASADAASALLARFAELVRDANAHPGSALARLQYEASQVGWRDARALLANAVGLLSQTYEATAGLIGNSIVALATQPALLDAMRREPGKLLQMVNEVSRFDPSIHNTRRFVAEATQVAGVSLQPGDVVLLVLAAAGRDPLCNARPDEFLLDRPDRDVPGFGRGAHQCPGQALACQIAAAAVKTLLVSGRLQAASSFSWQYRPSMNARIPVFVD